MAEAGLDAAALRADAAQLVDTVPAFAPARPQIERIAFERRPPGFGTLTYIILEQQVSIAAAKAMYAKLQALIGAEPEPRAFLALDDGTLRSCGFSRQKAAYARGLAGAIADGSLDLGALAAMDDDSAIARLVQLKGIGPWSAECYLLWCHGRRDILPAGDLALQLGWQLLTGAETRPTAADLREAAEPWRPRRTAASLLIWYHYLAQPARQRKPAVPARPAPTATAPPLAKHRGRG